MKCYRASSITNEMAPVRRELCCSLLLKSDHPRAIDRYIDYFGGSPGARLEDRAATGSANDKVALEAPWVDAPWLAGGADRSGLRDVL